MEYEDVTDIQRRFSHVGGKAVSIKDFDLLKVFIYLLMRLPECINRSCMHAFTHCLGSPPLNPHPPLPRCWARVASER